MNLDGDAILWAKPPSLRPMGGVIGTLTKDAFKVT
jgi:hypothetical protein